MIKNKNDKAKQNNKFHSKISSPSMHLKIILFIFRIYPKTPPVEISSALEFIQFKSSSSLFTLLLFTQFFHFPKTFSIGFRNGEYGRKNKTLWPLENVKSRIDWTLWNATLSITIVLRLNPSEPSLFGNFDIRFKNEHYYTGNSKFKVYKFHSYQ